MSHGVFCGEMQKQMKGFVDAMSRGDCTKWLASSWQNIRGRGRLAYRAFQPHAGRILCLDCELLRGDFGRQSL